MKRAATLLFMAVIIGALFFAPGRAAQTERAQKFRKHPKAVPGRYIVVLEDWAAGSAGDQSFTPVLASGMALAYGGRIKHLYTHALQGFSIELPEEVARRMSLDPLVKFVEEDGQVRVNTIIQTGATWGLDRIDQRDLPLDSTYSYNPSGAGVDVYVVDTGLRITHTEFGRRASIGFDAFGGNGADCNGHGTHVAGTIGGLTHGVAKGVNLIGVRVLDCEGNGTDSSAIAGIEWVRKYFRRGTPSIANLSFGGGPSAALDQSILNLIYAGVTVVVAAGNDNRDAVNFSPARVTDAITVGATTSTDARSDFSNTGKYVDLFAPGSAIKSAWSTSDTATNTLYGTSMAAPHVAGVAALYLQYNPTATPWAVANQIVSAATAGRLTNIGSGSPNRLLYSPLTTGDADPPSACFGGQFYSGSLAASGSYEYQPAGSFYYSGTNGEHRGCMAGPASGADFDLYLQKWNGSAWITVARSEGTTADEYLSYTDSSGYYRWKIYSYDGAGSYDFWLLKP